MTHSELLLPPPPPFSPCFMYVVMQDLALDAVQTVARDVGGGRKEVDIKNYAKIEKIPGGTIEDCKVWEIRCLYVCMYGA